MKLQIQSLHFDADKKLLDYVTKKMDKLDTFHDKIIDGEVIMRLEKDTNQENKLVECKVHLPGMPLFVKEKSRTFEAAIDEAVESLKIQIKKQKEKAARV